MTSPRSAQTARTHERSSSIPGLAPAPPVTVRVTAALDSADLFLLDEMRDVPRPQNGRMSLMTVERLVRDEGPLVRAIIRAPYR
jgi:hypothetical protein